MKIICLFSIDNDYDQPQNNLVCFWSSKPDVETLFKAIFNKSLLEANDTEIVSIVNVWQNKAAEFQDHTEYRLQEVYSGEML